MKMKIYEVIDKLNDIDALIDRNEDEGDTETVDMLKEYRDSILDTDVTI